MWHKPVSIVCIVLFLMLGWITITVPVGESTGPAILTLASGFGAWYLWPKKKNEEKKDLIQH